MIACKDCPMMECINRTALGGCGDFGQVAEPLLITSNHKTKVEFMTDWEQVRIQAAIAAMQGILSNNLVSRYKDGYTTRESYLEHGLVAKKAVAYATALIEELKKEK